VASASEDQNIGDAAISQRPSFPRPDRNRAKSYISIQNAKSLKKRIKYAKKIIKSRLHLPKRIENRLQGLIDSP